MARVAVVGGGIFGASAAVSLARVGHSVKVFERNSTILSGTTESSTKRLHLGFHYPRDRETGVQSVLGSKSFLRAFPGAVNNSFPNYYGVMKKGSKTSASEFQAFISELDLPASQIQMPPKLKYLGLDPGSIAGVWLAQEGSIDVDLVRQVLVRRCADLGVELALSASVERIERKGQLWRVIHSSKFEDFDVIVKATYGSDHILHDSTLQVRPKVFELAMNLEVSSPLSPFGLTLIDGDFLTILPNGFSSNLLIYAPGPSVIRREETLAINAGFTTLSSGLLKTAEKEILKRLREWLPKFGKIHVVSRLVGLRTLLPESQNTDARQSNFSEVGENFFEIGAGKIDHAVTIAEELAARLQQ